MKAPVRKITSRYSGANGITLVLECGHTRWSYNGRQKQKNIGCFECGAALERKAEQ